MLAFFRILLPYIANTDALQPSHGAFKTMQQCQDGHAFMRPVILRDAVWVFKATPSASSKCLNPLLQALVPFKPLALCSPSPQSRIMLPYLHCSLLSCIWESAHHMLPLSDCSALLAPPLVQAGLVSVIEHQNSYKINPCEVA
jgi:hypothetical protein